MCDYCDCRRITEIAELGAEHERIEELADAALVAARTGDATEEIERLRQALAPHAEREESGVFAEARASRLGSFYVDDLEEDHRRFAAALAEPELLDADTLEDVLDGLHRHIALEEYDLFPAAAQVLSEQQWEEIEGRSPAVS